MPRRVNNRFDSTGGPETESGCVHGWVSIRKVQGVSALKNWEFNLRPRWEVCTLSYETR